MKPSSWIVSWADVMCGATRDCTGKNAGFRCSNCKKSWKSAKKVEKFWNSPLDRKRKAPQIEKTSLYTMAWASTMFERFYEEWKNKFQSIPAGGRRLMGRLAAEIARA